MHTQWSRNTLRAALLFLTAAGATACGSDDPVSPILPVPTGLAAAQASLTQINLSWTAVSGATSYIVQRASAAAPGVFATIATPATAAPTKAA